MWAVMLYKNGKAVEVLTDGVTLSGATAFAAGHGVSSRGVPVVMPSSQVTAELTELIELFDAADADTRSRILKEARYALSYHAIAAEHADDCEGEGEIEEDPQLRAIFVGIDHAENGPGVMPEAIGGRVAEAVTRELGRMGHSAEIYELQLSFSEVQARGRVVSDVPSVNGAKWLPAKFVEPMNGAGQVTHEIDGGRYVRS